MIDVKRLCVRGEERKTKRNGEGKGAGRGGFKRVCGGAESLVRS